MSKFVSCHAKYFKKSQVAGLGGHHVRTFEYNANVYPEFTPFNFTTTLNQNFNALESKMVMAKRIAGKKSSNLYFRNDANVLIDNVLIFSREQLDFLKEKCPDNWQAYLEKSGQHLAFSIQKEFGLTPIDIHWHFDEGHYDENGVFKHNYHAHMTFFNFDFKTLEQPLRKMKRSDFSKIQDLAANSFARLGFERGVKKSVTGKSHKEKAEFLADSLRALELQRDELALKIQAIEVDYNNAVSQCARMETRLKTATLNLKLTQDQLDGLIAQITALNKPSTLPEYLKAQKIERLERENTELRERLGLNKSDDTNSFEEGFMQHLHGYPNTPK